ncbi:hypothetical protein KCP69_26155 [Salmonella enterica subsp. enterica]|nr:hypothetical protein KCP69_26155 [Salmonella enterica subsp. enterica]
MMQFGTSARWILHFARRQTRRGTKLCWRIAGYLKPSEHVLPCARTAIIRTSLKNLRSVWRSRRRASNSGRWQKIDEIPF